LLMPPVRLPNWLSRAPAWYRKYVEGLPAPSGDDVYTLFGEEPLHNFIRWVGDIFSIKTPELRRQTIVAVMYGTFDKNELESRKFWNEVARGGVEFEENHPTTVLDAFFKTVAEDKKKLLLKPGNFYQASIYAWNAFREQRPLTNVKYTPRRDSTPSRRKQTKGVGFRLTPPSFLDWGLSVATGQELHVLDRGVDMLTSTEVDELITAIRDVSPNPTLIVLDTLARNFGGGDENSTKDMNAFVAGCDRLRESFPNVTVLVVHHAGKAQRSGDRGSTALRGAVDTRIELTRNEKKTGQKTHRLSLTCRAQKDAPEFDPIRLRLACREEDDSCLIESWHGPIDEEEWDDADSDVKVEKYLGVLWTLESFGEEGARRPMAEGF
jgi:hypothetical protein